MLRLGLWILSCAAQLKSIRKCPISNKLANVLNVTARVSDAWVPGICVSQYIGHCSRGCLVGKDMILAPPWASSWVGPPSPSILVHFFVLSPRLMSRQLHSSLKWQPLPATSGKAERWRVGFLGWRNFLQTDSRGRPLNGNFRRQSGLPYPPENHPRWIWGVGDYANHLCKNIYQ